MFIYRLSNQPQHMTLIQSAQRMGAGKHMISADFNYDGGGAGKGATVILMVDGKKVAEGRIPATIGLRFSLDETWDIGEDTGTPLDFKTYDVPYKFNGELHKVTVSYK